MRQGLNRRSGGGNFQHEWMQRELLALNDAAHGNKTNDYPTAFAAMSTDVLCRTTLADIWMAEAPASVGMSSCSPEP